MSDRTLDSNLIARSASDVFSYLVFVELQFPSGTIYAHNGQGSYEFNGNTWLGVGAFGNIGAMRDSVDITSQPITITLSSITDEIITAIQSDNIYNKTATIYVGAIDEELELLGTPDVWIDGYMEKKELVLGETSAVAITVLDDSAKLLQRTNRRYTLEEHQKRYPGDEFLEYLPYLQHLTLEWAGERVRNGIVNEGSIGTGRSNSAGRNFDPSRR